MAGIDAELADDAREHDELRLAGEDLLLGADDVDVDRVGHGLPSVPLPRPRGPRHCSVFAFSNACSIVPTM